jgi:hypothetical protein
MCKSNNAIKQTGPASQWPMRDWEYSPPRHLQHMLLDSVRPTPARAISILHSFFSVAERLRVSGMLIFWTLVYVA